MKSYNNHILISFFAIILLFSFKTGFAQDTNIDSLSTDQLIVLYAQGIENNTNTSSLRKELISRIGEENTAVVLSEVFEKGKGVTEHPQKAFLILHSLLKNSSINHLINEAYKKETHSLPFYPTATFEYACMLSDGYGCAPDSEKAVNLLIKCAEMGYRPALRELALISKEQGIDINNDYVQLLMRESNRYDSFQMLANGFIQVVRNNLHGIINQQGKVILPAVYEKPIQYQLHCPTVVCKNTLYGFSTPDGQELFPTRFYFASDFSEDLAIVYDEEGWAIVDIHGNVKLIDDFDAVGMFTDGMAIVEKNNRQGAINTDGQIIIPPLYDELQAFSCGLAAVRKGNKWGYVDHKGNVVIDIIYDKASPFVNTKQPFSLVTYKGKEFCINTKGKKTKVK